MPGNLLQGRLPHALGFVAFAGVAPAWSRNPVWGVWGLGLLCIGTGVGAILANRISYGVRGRPAAGYLTGFPVFLFALGQFVIATLCFIDTPLVLQLFGRR